MKDFIAFLGSGDLGNQQSSKRVQIKAETLIEAAEKALQTKSDDVTGILVFEVK